MKELPRRTSYVSFACQSSEKIIEGSFRSTHVSEAEDESSYNKASSSN